MKNVVIGITGGIAVYKVASLVRLFKKAGINVDIIMTDSATKFVTPLTFETLSNNAVVTDMFANKKHYQVEHISLAQKADLFVVAPATANIIGKYANGIADDMLSTTLMATTAPVVICTAMNTNMYQSPACCANRQLLADRGVHFVDSDSGYLACGDVGKGRMAEPQHIFDYCMSLLYPNRDLVGKKVLVTVGATEEHIDAVRVMSNHSSGIMGSCIINECLQRGAQVVAIAGKHTAQLSQDATVIDVDTTQAMLDATLDNIDGVDIAIMTAAPCDYRPSVVATSKLKGDNITIDFVKNVDIASAVGHLDAKPILVIFSAETDNGVANAKSKLVSKNADFVVLNMIGSDNVFGSLDNTITVIDKHEVVNYDKMSKKQCATTIVDKVVTLL